MQLTLALHRLRRCQPDTTATIDAGVKRPWHVTVDRIARRASAIRAHGVGLSDRVALVEHNSADLFEGIMATLWAGAAFVPINLRWSADEVSTALKDCEPSLILVAEDCVDRLPYESGVDTSRAPVSSLAEIGTVDAASDTRASGNDLATILYTGGTTGNSKGVMLSHGNLMASALGYAGNEACAPGPVMLHTAPMFHIGALSAIFAALLRGSSHAFMPRFDPGALMRLVAAERVTDTFLVPTMLHLLLEQPDIFDHDLSSIERVLYGASPMTPTLMARAMRALPNVGFVQAYGMTELSPVVSLLAPADHGPAAQTDGRIRSAGRPTMTVDARIVDPVGVEVPRGEVGEVVVRGPTVMQGYWNQPELTAAVVRDGWMHTGDAGWMSADGYLHIVDRLKDMIITGGENVYSAEVERALSAHPGVAQCAVVGFPDAIWGERVHAVVLPAADAVADADALKAFCRTRIADFKCPKSIEFRDSLPLSPVGKVSKVALRQSLEDARDGGSK